MATRPKEPKRGDIAVTATILVLAGCFAAPVLAASDRSLSCTEKRAATLDVATHELTLTSHEVSSTDNTESAATTIESVADDHLLKPRVEAAARKVFADDGEETQSDDEAESDIDEVTESRLRPVSDNELVPFRRQMFRRDI